MGSIRKMAAVMTTLWLVGVVVIGVGGTWAYHNQDEVAEGALAAAGMDVGDVEAQERAKEEKRREILKAAKLQDKGWGDTAVADEDQPDDWGN